MGSGVGRFFFSISIWKSNFSGHTCSTARTKHHFTRVKIIELKIKEKDSSFEIYMLDIYYQRQRRRRNSEILLGLYEFFDRFLFLFSFSGFISFLFVQLYGNVQPKTNFYSILLKSLK